jgi:hypothetical protein
VKGRTLLPFMFFIILSTSCKACTRVSDKMRLLSASGCSVHYPICEMSDNYMDLSCGRFSPISDIIQLSLSSHLLLKVLKSTDGWHIMQTPIHQGYVDTEPGAY